MQTNRAIVRRVGKWGVGVMGGDGGVGGEWGWE